MTIQMMDLKKWQTIEEGEIVHFNKENPRTVRIDVNAAQTTHMFVAQGPDADAEFLCVVYGRDRVEFSVDGPFDLTVDGGAMSFYTVDGADFTVEKVDDESMTRIVERRVRNPEMDYIMNTMYRNMEMRFAQTHHELEKNYGRRLRMQEQRNAELEQRLTADASRKATATAIEAGATGGVDDQNNDPPKPAKKAEKRSSEPAA